MRLILVLITLISFNYNSFSQYSPLSYIKSKLIDSKSVNISCNFQEDQYHKTIDLGNKVNSIYMKYHNYQSKH